VSIYALGDRVPRIDPDAFVHPDATVIGAVTLGPGASVWPGAVLRGDYGRIVIGARTSIQDGTVVHTTEQWPTLVGAGCVVGHLAHLEGCTIGERCLVGSGSAVLNRASVQDGGAVGAAALVPEGAIVPSGQIALGVPARCRPAPELADWLDNAVRQYEELGREYRRDLRRLD
jgi:carbonic anhydrase/acetyltransferase-like protein (isoleucine patch superfamily)